MKRILPIVLLMSVFLFYCSPEDGVATIDDNEDGVAEEVDDKGDDSEGDVVEEGSDNDGMPDETDNEVLVTYTNDVAAIISDNCLDCHGEETKNTAPISFHTYELLKEYSDIIQFRVKNSSNPMPPDSRGGLMAEENVLVIDKWIADGLLKN